MIFYGMTPYHLVLLEFDRRENFKVQIYNPYVIEIRYPNKKPLSTVKIVCNDLELDTLCSTFTYIDIDNFAGVYSLVIEENHLNGEFWIPVKNNTFKPCFPAIDHFLHVINNLIVL